MNTLPPHVQRNLGCGLVILALVGVLYAGKWLGGWIVETFFR